MIPGTISNKDPKKITIVVNKVKPKVLKYILKKENKSWILGSPLGFANSKWNLARPTDKKQPINNDGIENDKK